MSSGEETQNLQATCSEHEIPQETAICDQDLKRATREERILQIIGLQYEVLSALNEFSASALGLAAMSIPRDGNNQEQETAFFRLSELAKEVAICSYELKNILKRSNFIPSQF